MKRKTKLSVAFIGVAAVFLYCWLVGFPAAWTMQMADIANNTEKFTDKNGYAVPGEYSVSVDWQIWRATWGKNCTMTGRTAFL
ncbi:hypothetical protein [Paenibacillus sp. MMO-58]|uniref:hypothetical protein n=1 Tax=Paenibacillus sp. MMO-58 TaxID=3081290 RepID=UPI003017DC9F